MSRLEVSGAGWSFVGLPGAKLGKCDLRGSDLSSLEPGNVELRRAVIDWTQAATLAANLGLDVQAD